MRYERSEHDSLDDHLIRLTAQADDEIRADALSRIERRRTESALPAVRACLEAGTAPAVRGTALRALCALVESDAVEAVLPCLDDDNEEVRLGAMVGLLRYGGISGIFAAGERLTTMESSADPAERSFVANVIGGVESQRFYQPLLALLEDEDAGVRQSALMATGQVKHPRLLPLAINNLSGASTRSTAMGALVANGEAVMPFVEKALADETTVAKDDVIRLVRLCGQVKGPQAIAILKQHINHQDGEIRFQVLMSLNLCGYRADEGDGQSIEQGLRLDAEHALQVLLAWQDIGQDEAMQPLLRALDEEFDQIRESAFLHLSFIYDAQSILQAGDRLVASHEGDKALALEMLDVTLTTAQKALVFPLVDPSLSLAQRIRQLGKIFPLTGLGRDERLSHIISDPERVWAYGWTKACAMYAAGKMGYEVCSGAVEATLSSPEYAVRETAAWALHKLAPDRYQIHAAELAADPHPQVARLANHLAGTS